MNSLEKFNNSKELTPEQYAILIEKDIIEKYSPLLQQKTDKPISSEALKMEWIKKYAVEYRNFFNNHKDELIELYKREPEKAIDYVGEGIEGCI